MNKIIGIHYDSEISTFFDDFRNLDFFLISPGREVTFKRKVEHALRFMMNLHRFLTKYKVFIFVCPPYFHFFCLPILKLCRKTVVTLVVDAYSEIAKERFWQAPLHVVLLRKLLFPFYLLSELVSIKMSDKVFCVSKYLVKKFGRFNQNVFYTPNGAYVSFVSKVRPAKVDFDYIYYMGGFLKWRGIDLLVKAFETIRKNHDVKLLLAGGNEEELRYYPELKSLKLKDTFYLGNLPHEEAISYLKRAKIAVLPNRNTIFSRTISSIKVFEYIAAEVPQVCTNSGEHADWVRKLGVGIVVKDTPEDIARGIMKLLEDKKLYNKLKRNCKKRKWEIDSKRLRAAWYDYLMRVGK